MMKAALCTAAIFCILFVPDVLLAQTSSSGSLLVLSKQQHTLNIVDPVTLKIVARAPVGDDPHEVIASADGSTAYVSNYGGGTLHSLAVINLISHEALEPIDLGALRGPHGLTFAGDKVWFTVEGSKAIGSYDPAAKKVDWILGTGQNRTHMIHVSDDLRRIVTTNVSSGTVSIIEKVALRGQAANPARMDWNETVVIIDWDDSDGWYDHVMPPIVNQSASTADALTGPGTCGAASGALAAQQSRCGYGPRIPLLVISPFARKNFVDHTLTDQSSVVRFIEDNWQLPQIGNGSFDEFAGTLLNSFDFKDQRTEKVFLNPSTGQVVNQ